MSSPEEEQRVLGVKRTEEDARIRLRSHLKLQPGSFSLAIKETGSSISAKGCKGASNNIYIHVCIYRKRERLHVREKKCEGKILSGLYAWPYLIRQNNLQQKEERGEVRRTSARIINVSVVREAANVS